MPITKAPISRPHIPATTGKRRAAEDDRRDGIELEERAALRTRALSAGDADDESHGRRAEAADHVDEHIRAFRTGTPDRAAARSLPPAA